MVRLVMLLDYAEIFIFLAVAIGTVLGRVRIRGFSLGVPACILVVAVILGRFGTIVIPSLLKSILFGLFVFTIGYRSGPEFFASLSLQTLSQVALALVMGACGLIILIFAYTLHLDTGTAAGVGAGSLTQTAMMGTASSALEQLGLSADVLKQQQANIAAGYAVTYILGYILVLLFVPFVAPLLMGVNLSKRRRQSSRLRCSAANPPSPAIFSIENFRSGHIRCPTRPAAQRARSSAKSAGARSSSAFSAMAKT